MSYWLSRAVGLTVVSDLPQIDTLEQSGLTTRVFDPAVAPSLALRGLVIYRFDARVDRFFKPVDRCIPVEGDFPIYVLRP